MRFRVIVLLATLTLSSWATAHGGHPEPVSDNKARAIAVSIAHRFAGKDPQLGFGEMSTSWTKVGLKQSEVIKKGDGYLIVKIDNPDEESDLYILMDAAGEVYDANLTGAFEGL